MTLITVIFFIVQTLMYAVLTKVSSSDLLFALTAGTAGTTGLVLLPLLLWAVVPAAVPYDQDSEDENDAGITLEDLNQAFEKERWRIRRDLHDGLGPLLAAAVMGIDAAWAKLSPSDCSVYGPLAQARGAIHSAVGRLRRLVKDLRVPMPDGMNLATALRAQVTRFQLAAAGRFTVELDLPGSMGPLPEHVELTAYHIACEALANVAKHAQASKCLIQLRLGRELSLEIIDDGIGIGTSPTDGMGLASIRARAHLLGGRVVLRRLHPQGTSVYVTLPVVSDDNSSRR